jgi:calcineurin-like phosphoesterase family protein
MLKTLKFNHDDKQKVYFSSDYHANHLMPFVWQSRGYNSPEEHTAALIEITNAIVKENDIFIHLGDLTLNTSEEQFEDFIGKINCKNLYSLHGNHPNPSSKIYKREIELQFKLDSKQYEIYPLRYKNVIFLPNYVELSINGFSVIVSHYPLRIWNFMARTNCFHVSGHSHGGDKERLISSNSGRCLDVGFDIFKKPMSFDELKDIMAKKSMIKLDATH